MFAVRAGCRVHFIDSSLVGTGSRCRALTVGFALRTEAVRRCHPRLRYVAPAGLVLHARSERLRSIALAISEEPNYEESPSPLGEGRGEVEVGTYKTDQQLAAFQPETTDYRPQTSNYDLSLFNTFV